MGIKRPLIMDMEPGEEKTMKAMTSSDAKLAATCEQVGGGTPDTQAADKESKRLGKEAMRKRGVKRDVSSHHSGSREGMTTTTFQDREAAREMKKKLPPNYTPTKSGGANNYKLPTRPADGSGTGI